MPESYVYIDAPSLDNSDQSKFIVNEDFGYVSAGDSSIGSVAQFPLYSKFIGADWKNSVQSNALPRTNFKSGKWALSGNINLGGDYVAGNTAQVHISNFIVGKLEKLRFRFFKKSEITDANRNEDFVHNEIDNYEDVPKVYILASIVENDKTTEYYKLVAIANRSSENIYVLDRDFYITGKNLVTNNFRLVFIFAPIDSNIIIDENSVYEFTSGSLRSFAREENQKVGLRSVPRGPLDNKSYICQDSGTTGGIRNGQNRLLDFDYYIDNDLVEEYLGGASSRHHISALDIENLNYLKYSAPAISPAAYRRKNTSAKKVFISNASLTRNNIFPITGEKITSIQIPFEASYNGEDYEDSAMIDSEFNGGPGSLWHTNRVIWIWQGTDTPPDLTTEEETNINNGWKKSNEVFAFSYFEVPITYVATFDSNNITYEGNGIWISAVRPSGDKQGKGTLAVHYYENESGKYSYNVADKIYSTFTSDSGGFNATANIKVIFNYKLRNDWFDYIEERLISLNNINDRISAIENALREHLIPRT